MGQFYVIKCVNSEGEVGWLVDHKEGIQLVVGGFHSDITQFKTYQKAQIFLLHNKIERNGTRAYIVSNEQLMKEMGTGNIPGVMIGTSEMCYIENERGEKLFFDPKQQAYHFEADDVGYCCWKTKEDAEKFIEAYELKSCSAKFCKEE